MILLRYKAVVPFMRDCFLIILQKPKTAMIKAAEWYPAAWICGNHHGAILCSTFMPTGIHLKNTSLPLVFSNVCPYGLYKFAGISYLNTNRQRCDFSLVNWVSCIHSQSLVTNSMPTGFLM